MKENMWIVKYEDLGSRKELELTLFGNDIKDIIIQFENIEWLLDSGFKYNLNKHDIKSIALFK